MGKVWFIVILLAALAFGWYFFVYSKSAPVAVPTPIATPVSTMPLKTVSSIILSEQNDSGESGTATLTEIDGKVKVTLEMTGFAEGVTQPAHIHLGACPDVGAVKYPLTSVSDGMSVTTIDMTLEQLKPELPLGINVHKSQAEASVYVSCGDISL
jgi:hypothetical protein